MSKAVHRLAADGPYTISEDDLESLAVGSWILGTGGGGSTYIGLLNMRRLYAAGARVTLIDPAALADYPVAENLVLDAVSLCLPLCPGGAGFLCFQSTPYGLDHLQYHSFGAVRHCFHIPAIFRASAALARTVGRTG